MVTAIQVINLVLNTLVWVFTVTKTFSDVIEARRLKMKNGLPYFILRDGDVTSPFFNYFLLISQYLGTIYYW